MGTSSKMKKSSIMKMTSKKKTTTKKRTFHLDSHSTNDIKLKILSVVQTGNRIPQNEYDIRGIVHAHGLKTDNIFMQRQLLQTLKCLGEVEQGTKHPEYYAQRL